MKIILNNIKTEINNTTTLLELVSIYQKETFGLAIAVNDVVIPKEKWSIFKIKNYDNVVLFQAIAGG
ncbi:sulfur carrier protein [Wigglesworthia glossinidia endosymbiont of Glossina morsitans morsitans (Yale colony)]|uniref:Sulfur carrier protein n=1 Tax=Wigglesworthia glossinidia endosymbiont of Glossina morsitans morsitans (Yale colony) TaxID=1142511 RepID=H6Q4N2_WIGGL|nr:sulfur carrier protein ThiS [Wigglesworthia glossinidia]AFA41092.1 sulfur carrier protein [Wigglesworthia glossinidia endosymbiont of Glossina morsitans morsitans (Yale colony)]